MATAEPGSRNYNRAIKRMVDKLSPILQQLSRRHSSPRQIQQLTTANAKSLREIPGGDDILAATGQESGVTFAAMQQAQAPQEDTLQKIAGVVSFQTASAGTAKVIWHVATCQTCVSAWKRMFALVLFMYAILCSLIGQMVLPPRDAACFVTLDNAHRKHQFAALLTAGRVTYVCPPPLPGSGLLMASCVCCHIMHGIGACSSSHYKTAGRH